MKFIIHRAYLPVLIAVFVIFFSTGCRGGASTGGDVFIPYFTPTVTPQKCLNDRYPDDFPQYGDESTISYTFLGSGLGIFDRKLGGGDFPTPDSLVNVHYTGFLDDGCVFDSSYPRGMPGNFPISGLITGMQEAISTMRVGGVRRVRIPPDLGYKDSEIRGVIPANSTLIFELELVGFTDAGSQNETSVGTDD